MAKKCIICENAALYAIRGTNDFYCHDCATDSFDDIGVLEELGKEE